MQTLQKGEELLKTNNKVKLLKLTEIKHKCLIYYNRQRDTHLVKKRRHNHQETKQEAGAVAKQRMPAW